MGVFSTLTVVNSWNEWDPLKHVIVGVADGCCIPPAEPASEPKIPVDSDMRGRHGPRPPETVAHANELLNDFVRILEGRGIRVDAHRLQSEDQYARLDSWDNVWLYASQGCPSDVG